MSKAPTRKWTWFHRFGSPKWFYHFSSGLLPWLWLAVALCLVAGLVWGLAFAPADAKQGNSFRIIYIHVPTSFLALAGYYLMALAGAVGLVWRIKLAMWVLRAAAPLGAVLTFISLFSGAIWGKPTWGTWWVWDARITSMLILFFLYLGVIALQQAFQNEEGANRASAVLALVGMVNIPIIYKSVDWWNTLHQPATIKMTEAPSMHPDMWHPLLLMIVAFYLFYALVLILNLRCEILRHESRSQWVRELCKSRS
ncbi:MAG: heme ABC transporter permease [Pseudomonadales bacterium]|nr:heme ABC transporter permease [Pseudomonadales bacterium]